MVFNKLQWCSMLLILLFSSGNGLKESEVKDVENILIRERRAPQQTSQPCQGGLPGLPGRDGRDGRDATLRGPPGMQGKRGQRGPKGDIGSVAGGAVYTRWGRDVCPKNTNSTKLYSGVMGGSWYEHSGGASNYLCLPLDPIYDKVVAGSQGHSYIYGVEYQVAGMNIFPTNIHDHDAPCAVCHTEFRRSRVMIPARNVCPTGWMLEYKGYLMSGHPSHKGRTEFICVDGKPTPTARGHADEKGALLYFVEGYCGSLPCGPYIQGNELTCAVCTK